VINQPESPAYNADSRCPRRVFARHSRPIAFFITSALPAHVQGNQNIPLCLEEKQSCVAIEQRSQLAREVRHAIVP
jgi:hypothetical protein